MRARWRILLPVIGLLLFAGVSHDSVRMNREVKDGRYYWWSSIRLDSDPLNRHAATNNCKTDAAGCLGPIYTWVDPGWLTKSLMLSSFPAFLIAEMAVRALGCVGVNEVTTFMISMPPLLVAWYYLLGWLIDRRCRRSFNAAANS
jgi:hypothetical protein